MILVPCFYHQSLKIYCRNTSETYKNELKKIALLSLFQVPKGLPYFAVEFGLDGGFAHVIEEEQNFHHYFGKVRLKDTMENI